MITPKRIVQTLRSRAKRIATPLLLAAAIFGLSSCQLLGAAAYTAISLLPLKLYFACLPEGTQIDTPDGSTAVEALKPGDQVLGYDGQIVKVKQVHAYDEDEEALRFLKITFNNGSEVDLCDMHRIGGIRAKNLQIGDSISSGHTVTDISTYGGVERSYDLITEDAGYQIGNIPVNSMIEEMYEAGRTGKIKE